MGDLADLVRDREAYERADELQRAMENDTVCCEREHNLEEDSSVCFNYRDIKYITHAPLQPQPRGKKGSRDPFKHLFKRNVMLVCWI